jgi:hypothetical protein
VTFRSHPTRRVHIRESHEFLEQQTLIIEEGTDALPTTEELTFGLTDAEAVLVYAHSTCLAQRVLASAPSSVLRAIDVQDVSDAAVLTALSNAVDWVFVSWPTTADITAARNSSDALASLHAFGFRNVVLKLGPGGAIVSAVDEPALHIPALLGPMVHSVGAGDAFDGVFLAEVRSGQSTLEAGHLAAAAAAFLIRELPPRFGDRAGLLALERERIAVYSPPEQRVDVRVGLLCPVRSAAERVFAKRLAAGIREHDFHVYAIDNHSLRDSSALLASIHAVVAVLDGMDPMVMESYNTAILSDLIVIGFWSSVGAPPRMAHKATVVVGSESELLSALYVLASSGRGGLALLNGPSSKE